MARYYRVKEEDIFFSQNNGMSYMILGKGDKLYEVRTWLEDEDGEIDHRTVSYGHITEQELKALIKEETGLNYEIIWEENEDDRI